MTATNYLTSDSFSSLALVVRGAKRENAVTITASANVLNDEQKIDRELTYAVARELTVNDSFSASVYLRVIDEQRSKNPVVEALVFSFVVRENKIVVTESVLNNKKHDEIYTLDASKAYRGKSSARVLDSGPLVLKALHDVLKKHNVKIVKIASNTPRKSTFEVQINSLNEQIKLTEQLRNAENSAIIDQLITPLRAKIAELTSAHEKRSSNKSTSASTSASTTSA